MATIFYFYKICKQMFHIFSATCLEIEINWHIYSKLCEIFLYKKVRKGMILEYKVNEISVQAAWLKTLYDLVEELNCKCQTYIDETYNRSNKNFDRMRTIKIYGSDTMLSWFKLRMERYTHFIFNFNEQPDIKSAFSE